jgi:hypothetical protein
MLLSPPAGAISLIGAVWPRGRYANEEQHQHNDHKDIHLMFLFFAPSPRDLSSVVLHDAVRPSSRQTAAHAPVT